MNIPLRRRAEKAWNVRDLIARIADDLHLTPAERDQEIPSGGTKLIANRVHCAKTYLKKAGLLEQPTRATVLITQRGREVLNGNPDSIGVQSLLRFPEMQASSISPNCQRSRLSIKVSEPPAILASTPEEQLEVASGALNEAVRDALLTRILEASSASFERLIIDLLLKMGYGGSRADAGEHLGRSGDGAVEGVIREDRLGLDRVYLQAKRYKPDNSPAQPARGRPSAQCSRQPG
jgi:restriction system protein